MEDAFAAIDQRHAGRQCLRQRLADHDDGVVDPIVDLGKVAAVARYGKAHEYLHQWGDRQ